MLAAAGESVTGEDGQPQGMRLDLSGFASQVLPEIPTEVEFAHVTELSLSSMDLEQVPTPFLRCFGSVRRLNLADNRLRRVPQGLGYLSELRSLQLARNGIRLDAAGIAILTTLPELQVLDLSFNPLGRRRCAGTISQGWISYACADAAWLPGRRASSCANGSHTWICVTT